MSRFKEALFLHLVFCFLVGVVLSYYKLTRKAGIASIIIALMLLLLLGFKEELEERKNDL